MRLSVKHETRYAYSDGASGAVMRLRLMPRTTNAQTVQRWSVTVNEALVQGWSASSYGDNEALWRSTGVVREAVIVAEGTVETFDRAGIHDPHDEDVIPAIFLRETPLTAVDAGIADFAQAARSPDGTLATLHALAAQVYGAINYRPGVTSMTTTASEALELGAGVCQDQSQIFVAAARTLGIPARYVTGYLLDRDRFAAAHDSHAWAEGFVEGLGWVGFDCTLGLCPSNHHVRLTCGMDAADAAPIRGVVQVAGGTAVVTDVHIAEISGDNHVDGASQSQAQQ
jgi:transglutaminase-like putative cysteine protease